MSGTRTVKLEPTQVGGDRWDRGVSCQRGAPETAPQSSRLSISGRQEACLWSLGSQVHFNLWPTAMEYFFLFFLLRIKLFGYWSGPGIRASFDVILSNNLCLGVMGDCSNSERPVSIFLHHRLNLCPFSATKLFRNRFLSVFSVGRLDDKIITCLGYGLTRKPTNEQPLSNFPNMWTLSPLFHLNQKFSTLFLV